jgi:tetratricopeptide (TPR) repeat protein
VGREAELSKLEEWVGFCPKKTPQRSIVTLWGFSGVGKSQLVSEFVKQQREKYPGYDIFWIAGATKEAFEQSILSVLKLANNPEATISEGGESYDEHRSMLINSFFTELKNMMRARWLLVIDGIPGDSSLQQHIRNYLDGLPWGSIILTTRSTEVASWYHGSIEIRGLPEVDAVNLLDREIDERFRSGGNGMSYFSLQLVQLIVKRLTKYLDLLEIARMLNCHPLSLRLATSVMSYYHLSVRQYVEKWRTRQLYDEYPTNMALLRSFELSFEELEKTNPVAAKLLMLFGYLDHRDLWADLCLNATDDDLPTWLREIGSSKCFHGYYASMRNLAFVEAKLHGKKDQAYEIHPAIHEFARWKAKENEEEYVKTAISLVAAKVPRSTDKDFLEIVQRLEPHADQCKIHMEQGRAGSSLDLMELERFGNLFRHLGRYDEATRLYWSILNVINREDEPDEFTLEMMAGIENNLGLIHHARRQYDLALRAYEQSYLRRLRIVPKDDDSLMTTQYNKGRAFLMLGRLDEALQTLLKAAAHFSQLIPPDAWDNHGLESGDGAMAQIYFRILNDVGEIYLRKNDVEQAEQNFRMAFDGHKKYLHEMHPTTFAVRLNIGRVCVERSRFATANKIFEYIIATYTEWWGRRHSETIRALTELAESHTRHAEQKRLMGDGGGWELTMAADLWAEILSFHHEVSGPNSDAASFARSKLQQVQLLRSVTPGDPYSMYYS